MNRPPLLAALLLASLAGGILAAPPARTWSLSLAAGAPADGKVSVSWQISGTLRERGQLRLFADTDDNLSGGTCIAERIVFSRPALSGVFVWDLANVPPGTYRVYGVGRAGPRTQKALAPEPVTVTLGGVAAGQAVGGPGTDANLAFDGSADTVWRGVRNAGPWTLYYRASAPIGAIGLTFNGRAPQTVQVATCRDAAAEDWQDWGPYSGPRFTIGALDHTCLRLTLTDARRNYRPGLAEVALLPVSTEPAGDVPASFYNGRTSFQHRASATSESAVYANTAGDVAATTPDGSSNSSSTTTRDVVESDIYRVAGDYLYYFNAYRGLQVIDLGTVDRPRLLASVPVDENGQEMYVTDTLAVLLTYDWPCYWPPQDATSTVRVFDVSQPSAPVLVAALPLTGRLTDSRLVGSVLYVATAINEYSWEALTAPETRVSSIDLGDPAQPRLADTLSFPGAGGFVQASAAAMLVASQDWHSGAGWLTSVQAVDISDPSGALKLGTRTDVPGRVADKYKLSLNGDVLAVFFDFWEQNQAHSAIATYRLGAARRAAVLLDSELLCVDEQLYATRFDGTRAYAVTFRQVDPLWILDLSDPADIRVAGELEVPGYSTHIEPWGDRLVTVGVDPTTGWQVAVSLFDVSDPASPALLSRARVGEEGYSWSEALQDERAFCVLREAGLVLLPFTGRTAAGTWGPAVQLIDLDRDALAVRGQITQAFAARRATVAKDRILAISDRLLQVADATDRDRPLVTAELPLARSVDRIAVFGAHTVQLEQNDTLYYTNTDATAQTTAKLLVFPLTDVNGMTPVASVDVGTGTARFAVQHGTRLYLWMSPAWRWYWDGPVVALRDDSATAATARLVEVDFADPTQPVLIGQAAVVDDDAQAYGYATVGTGVFCNDGSTLVVPVRTGWWYPYYYLDVLSQVDLAGVANGLGADVAGMRRPWFWDYTPSTRLLAFRVGSREAPALASRLEIEGTSDETLVASGATIYLNTTVRDDPTTDDAQWTTARDYLERIDYANPAEPSRATRVNIPGRMFGLALDGQVVYTLGERLVEPTTGTAGTVSSDDTNGSPWVTRQTLYCLAIRDDLAFLVDSLDVKGATGLATVHADTAYVAVGSAWNEAGAVWALTVGDSGTLLKLSTLTVPAYPSGLQAADGRLLVSSGDRWFSLFGISDPANPTALVQAQAPAYCTPQNVAWTGSALLFPCGFRGVFVLEVR